MGQEKTNVRHYLLLSIPLKNAGSGCSLSYRNISIRHVGLYINIYKKWPCISETYFIIEHTFLQVLKVRRVENVFVRNYSH
jgi:hypothetical protein